MPRSRLILFRELNGAVPVISWLDALAEKPRIKCLAALSRLAELGHELRRPEADMLTDGLYELRVRQGRVNFRMIYFFAGQHVVVVSHGFTKEDAVPPVEIERARARRTQFKANPDAHSAQGPPA